MKTWNSSSIFVSVLWPRVPLQSEPGSEDLPISRTEPWSLQEGGSGGAGGGRGGPGPRPRQAASAGPLSHRLLPPTALRIPGPHGRRSQYTDQMFKIIWSFIAHDHRYGLWFLWTAMFWWFWSCSTSCQVTQIASQPQLQAELTLRLTQLQTRLASLKIENEEVRVGA